MAELQLLIDARGRHRGTQPRLECDCVWMFYNAEAEVALAVTFGVVCEGEPCMKWRPLLASITCSNDVCIRGNWGFLSVD
ncbi:MAG: hypothetical protein JOZ58_06180 [Acetobacteraceae bacterium]|nr:hypothetical protein [Acetobacteraceae bacterium]MBV8574616.1 hypothetical protein [Acetobacteraceae bacterium]